MEAANGEHHLGEKIQNSLDLGHLLYLRRKAGGAIAHFDPERGIVTTPEGNKIKVRKGNAQAQLTVQELMTLFDKEAVKFLRENGYPIIYKNQLAPASYVDKATTRQTIMMLTQKEELSEDEERLRIKLIKDAFWDVRPMGHNGIGDDYSEFTKPARSFVSQYMMRILAAAVNGEPSPFSVEELEFIALRANRKDDDTLEGKVYYLRNEARQKARETIETGDFSRLLNDDGSINKKRVSRVINVASIEGRFNEAFVVEVLKMIDDDQLTSQDLMRLLFIASPMLSEVNPIKEGIIQRMTKFPGLASTVIHSGLEVLFNWSDLEVTDWGGFTTASIRIGGKILISDAFTPLEGGAKKARIDLIRRLSKLSHETTVFPSFAIQPSR